MSRGKSSQQTVTTSVTTNPLPTNPYPGNSTTGRTNKNPANKASGPPTVAVLGGQNRGQKMG